MNTFNVLVSKQRPFNVILSSVGPQGAAGAATVEGDLTNIDSLTLTCPDDATEHKFEVRLIDGNYVLRRQDA